VRTAPVFCLLVLFAPCRATQAADLTPKFEEFMDACVKIDHFNGSVLVAQSGETIFSKGYGLANAELGIPNTPQTKFRIGSITKQFTAMAILILNEQGKLKLDDPVGKFVAAAPKTWEKVTIHHLLTHTSGVHSYTSDPSYGKSMTHPETVKSMIARFKDRPLDFAPGTKFSYSNSGYFLLGAVIEKTAGKSYEAFLKEAIFDPLGLKDSGYDHPKTVLPHRASGYTRADAGLEHASYLDMGQPYAAGSLYSTVEDLARWDQALADGKLIGKDSYAKMFTPVKEHYAYGLNVETRSGKKEISHGGGINGFVSFNSWYPDQKVCVVVLSNVLPLNPGKVANGLAAIALGIPYDLPKEHKVAKVDPKIYDAYAGRYKLGAEMQLTISREGDRLMVQPTSQPKREVFPESETEFFLKVADVQFKFVKDGSGKVTHVVVRQGTREEKAERIQ
jgi:CubicO group peptidase (beta-lactamase class C family)